MGLKTISIFILSFVLATIVFADSPVSKSPAGAKVYIIEPAKGATVASTFKVKFGLSGMGVAPAGVDIENTGHHHLLIDAIELPDLTKPLPATEKILHFGKGQTETEITLEPGIHSLKLILGNYLHIPHNPPLISDEVIVTVE